MESRLFALNAGLIYMCIYIYINIPILYILSYTYAHVHIHIYIYSLLHLECHLISNSNLNFRGLFSMERGKKDPEN